MAGYAVVEFVSEKAVAVVCEKWIETCDGVMYCYWPSNNVTAKLKKAEMPDKKTWQRCRIRVFSFADSYDKALKQAKCAEDTSNVDSSDSEINIARKRTRPSRYTELPGWSDDEQSDYQDPKSKRHSASSARESTKSYTPLLPVAPTLPSSFQFTSSPGMCTSNVLPGSTLPTIVNAIDNIFTPSHFDPFHNLNTDATITPTTSSSYARINPHHDYQQNFISMNSGTPRSTPPIVRSSSNHQAGQNQQENFQRCVLTKLDIMAQKQEEALSVLRLLLSATRGVGGSDMLEDVLPNPIDTVDDLEAFSVRLDDDEFKKKMLHFLVALCSHTCAVSVRRIMSKLGTNKLWSLYSLKGRKSKRPFNDISMCRIVIKACLRVHKNSNEVEVEEQIAEYLKHAPHKPGGLKYKNHEGSTE